MFQKLDAAIRRMIRETVLGTGNARDILRKSGFKPTSTTGSPRERSILSTPPIAPARGCPRPPYGASMVGVIPSERAAFYEMVGQAEDGNPGALDDMRDYLITFGYEDSIVMNGVMPLLTYDYAGEVWTFTLNSDAACPIEIDITPPLNGFWEQYADGDARFAAKNIDLAPGQDYRLLVKSVVLRTSEALGPLLPRTRLDAGSSYSQCPNPSGGVYTHEIDSIQTSAASALQTGTCVAFRKDYGPAQFANMPLVELANERLFHNAAIPISGFSGPRMGTAGWDVGTVTFAPYTASGRFSMQPRTNPPEIYIDEWFHACGEPHGTLEFAREHFGIMRSRQFQDVISSTDRYVDITVNKRTNIGNRVVDWSIDPAPPATTVVRYTQEWDTFDVVAVRMTGSGPALTPGDYVFP